LNTSVKLRLASLAATAMVLSAGTALSADLVISNWAGYMAPDIADLQGGDRADDRGGGARHQ
jgi:spermidine/putrescine transport system substrate-binding protein